MLAKFYNTKALGKLLLTYPFEAFSLIGPPKKYIFVANRSPAAIVALSWYSYTNVLTGKLWWSPVRHIFPVHTREFSSRGVSVKGNPIKPKKSGNLASLQPKQLFGSETTSCSWIQQWLGQNISLLCFQTFHHWKLRATFKLKFPEGYFRTGLRRIRFMNIILFICHKKKYILITST